LKLTLERAIEIGMTKAQVFMDSKFIVEQIQERLKIKNESLKLIK